MKPNGMNIRSLSKNARERTYHFGIGLVMTPIPQAQASLQFRGGTVPAALYYVQVTWVSANGTGRRAERCDHVRDPGRRPGVVTAANPPAVATGFNVYIGLTPNTLTLQNSSPVAVGRTSRCQAGLVIGVRARERAGGGYLHHGRSDAEARVSDGADGKRGDQIVVGFLTDPNAGISPLVAQLAADSGIPLAPIPPAQIVNQNVPVAMAERGAAVKYPVVHVYSDRVRNLLTEKFRTFSGKVRTVAEVRVSQDRIEGIEDQLRLYVDA